MPFYLVPGNCFHVVPPGWEASIIKQNKNNEEENVSHAASRPPDGGIAYYVSRLLAYALCKPAGWGSLSFARPRWGPCCFAGWLLGDGGKGCLSPMTREVMTLLHRDAVQPNSPPPQKKKKNAEISSAVRSGIRSSKTRPKASQSCRGTRRRGSWSKYVFLRPTPPTSSTCRVSDFLSFFPFLFFPFLFFSLAITHFWLKFMLYPPVLSSLTN